MAHAAAALVAGPSITDPAVSLPLKPLPVLLRPGEAHTSSMAEVALWKRPANVPRLRLDNITDSPRNTALCELRNKVHAAAEATAAASEAMAKQLQAQREEALQQAQQRIQNVRVRGLVPGGVLQDLAPQQKERLLQHLMRSRSAAASAGVGGRRPRSAAARQRSVAPSQQPQRSQRLQHSQRPQRSQRSQHSQRPQNSQRSLVGRVAATSQRSLVGRVAEIPPHASKASCDGRSACVAPLPTASLPPSSSMNRGAVSGARLSSRCTPGARPAAKRPSAAAASAYSSTTATGARTVKV
jgi:hypothetical protein